MATPRIYLTGQIALEHGDRLLTEVALPGRQSRIAFGFLAAHRRRPVSRGELIDAIWPAGPPPEVDAALSAILSKLRTMMGKEGWSGAQGSIDVHASSISTRFPPHTWIDVEAAVGAIDEAEGALRAADPARAWGFANVVVTIARRPFLMNYDAPWIDARRASMQVLLLRGLECISSACESAGDRTLAIQYAAEMIETEPFRESAYQRLMRLHAANGNRAEAIRVFERCRQVLAQELGTAPSPQTHQVLQELRG